MRASPTVSRPPRRRLSNRPRLRRLRRLARWGAGATLSIWLVLLVTGYEVIWARKREAFTLSGGTLTWYRSGWDYGYFLRAGGGGKSPATQRSLGAALGGRTLWHLSIAQMSSMNNWPAAFSNGLAINAVTSMPPQDSWFGMSRPDCWRYRVRLWWVAAAAVAPWCVGVMLMRGRLRLARWRLMRRRRPGRCHRCGYSAEGLPKGSPCPECGMGRA